MVSRLHRQKGFAASERIVSRLMGAGLVSGSVWVSPALGAETGDTEGGVGG